MTDAAPPASLHLMVAQDPELPPLLQAVARFAWYLWQELGQPWPLSYTTGPIGILPPARPTLVIVSMLHEMLPPFAPMSVVAGRWHAMLESLTEVGLPVLLCNVFRHIGPQTLGADFPSAQMLRDRARRLNLLAVELSHRHGADLADIDARLAAIGARGLETDFRLGGWGVAAAADTITCSLLQSEFQSLLPGNAGARTLANHGGVIGILARLQKAVNDGKTPAELDAALRRAV